MSSDTVLDFLTEELVVSKNIVTYRSLSHVLGIHINKAKNELAFYHSEHAGSLDAAYATYIIGGEPRTSYMDSLRDTDAMAVDEEEEMGSEYVPETKITLVSEADLETSKEQYARIDFVHIYCLSPVPIREPALLCEPAKSLREAGTSIHTGFTVELGRVSGPSWYIKKRTDLPQRRSSANTKSSAAASSSKDKLPGLSKAPSVKTEDVKPVVKSEPKDVKLEIKEPPKPRPSGKLDFSKAAAKPAPKPAPEMRKVESAAESSSTSAKVAIKSELKPSKSKDKLVENKSTLKRSDSEDGTKRAPSAKRTESKSAPRASVKKGVVISDDDEDEEAPKKKPSPSPSPPPPPKAAYKAKPKAAPPDPDAEKELRAMMDIDDEHVTKVSRRAVSLSEPATSPPATDVELEDRDPDPDPEPAPEPEPKPATRKPRQRKPKKEVPVGRNGLKKRRVVKSRTTMDEKGYFAFRAIVDKHASLGGHAVTEDYSSYESVDEETSPPEKPAAKGKGKGKGKKVSAPAVVKNESEADEKASKAPAKSAPSLKRKPSKPSVQQGGIASYFAKK
ncbi:DNA polymerase subunit Cdc27 [Russula dissimulans]|nr:DNA polymerase subunit Cdc27 [Russula dissimulans]